MAENGGVVWKAQYQVFGKAEVDSSSSVTNNLRFPGQYHDEETGMHYNWNRYYDPENGRYTQVDLIGFRGGLHLYIYANIKPIKLIDNLGLACFAYRPLQGAMKIFGVYGDKNDEKFNTFLAHEQLFFEDGGGISNIGFFDDGELKSEKNLQEYNPCHNSGWNDCVMRESVFRISKKKYNLLWDIKTGYKYNCQDWADDVRSMYRILIFDPEVLEKCKPTCSEMSK